MHQRAVAYEFPSYPPPSCVPFEHIALSIQSPNLFLHLLLPVAYSVLSRVCLSNGTSSFAFSCMSYSTIV